jgi:hypothetical protein
VTHWKGGDSPNAWLREGRIVFGHYDGNAPMPRWYVMDADATNVQPLPQLRGAGDPIDWLD